MAVGGAVASVAAAANGAIVHHNPADYTITGRAPVSAYVDLMGGTVSSSAVAGVSDLVFITSADTDMKPYTYLDQVAGSSDSLVALNGAFPFPNAPRLFTEGESIDAATGTRGIIDDPNSPQAGGSNSLYGYSFVEAGTTLFGWIRVSNSTDGADTPETETDDINTVVIHEWAYETSGAPIAAGAVPEASTSAMMAVLAGSAALYRRRGRKTTAA